MSAHTVASLLAMADDSLIGAEILLEGRLYGFAASRAYYTMFYAAEALLITRELAFSHHSAVIAAFGQIFAKEGLVPRHLHRYITDAFGLRQTGDYGPLPVSREMAERSLHWAAEFLQAAKTYLAAHPGNP